LKSLETRTIRQRLDELRGRIILKANIEFGPARRNHLKTHFLLPIRNRLLREKPISIKIDGISLRLAPVAPMATYLMNQPRSETRQLQFLLRFLEPGQVFIDAGADAGLFAIAVAKRIGQSGVYAFEPSEERFQLLLRNMELNGVSGLHAMQSALGSRVSDSQGPADFCGVDSAGWIGAPSHSKQSPAQQASPPITSLDDFVESNSIPNVDVVRISVGGAELPVLHGARQMLNRTDAPLIVCDALSSKTDRFGYHPVEIQWFLADCGYQLFVMDSKSARLAPRRPNFQYDVLVVAAKSHDIARLQLLGSSV